MPIVHPAQYEPVEGQLEQLFWDLFLGQAYTIAHGRELANASDPLAEAVRSGRVHYQDGTFSGRLSASVSLALRRLGARFVKRSGEFQLDPSRVPAEIRAEAQGHRERAARRHGEVLKALDEAEASLGARVAEAEVDAGEAMAKAESSLKSAAAKVSIPVDLSPESKAALAREYTGNMRLWIDKFSREQIAALRGKVEQNAAEGGRMDRLRDIISSRADVARSKAKFLARQETALFTAKMRQRRFGEAGFTMYRWSSSMDERTREDHRHLDGRVFSYAEPPVVDRATGRRGNPGEDFNCRCVDVPARPGEEAIR